MRRDRRLGREIDLLATWKATPAIDLAIGRSHFFGGAIYENLSDGEDVNFLYARTAARFRTTGRYFFRTCSISTTLVFDSPIIMSWTSRVHLSSP